MKKDFKEIIQDCCLIGIFIGYLLIDANIQVGAVIAMGSIILFLLLEKGVL